ncbi:ABC transporter-associated protein EcsC [Desulfuribacillus stibiiarsenatis]|uniref:ABC transporter-associated protein EcsC n=1 Tax=Desulfuribacillus stibiiarsenatis TaxID=1390249 RepID=A0A1E5L9Z0_9FIRM|nr:EcsC family protein [Desulfuribacillus stibiiarsenatis]OEH86947.1 ABC transporter-associated protein EcsC [Desulfuribacillus stibiiarsenatis]
MSYEDMVMGELQQWQSRMTKKPSLVDRATKGIQRKVNRVIPEKAHQVITAAIKNMVRAVLFGSEYITQRPRRVGSLEEREVLVKEKISKYKKTAAASGAGTGAGGILLGLADFPILLSIKIKFLFDVASIYGYNISDYRERLYVLHIFQLAFSSQERRNEVYQQIVDWDRKAEDMPVDIESFPWQQFQQEYRDYIDLAKMFQLVPIIGAFVGAYANYKLLDKLGETAMNAFRMRKLPSYTYGLFDELK